MADVLKFSTMTDEEVLATLKKNKIGLTVEEARKIESILGRPPTMTEAVVWGIQGSEHCSYKSSRRFLKQLPTDGPNVILGPKEDAGIVEIIRDGNDRWGLVMSHESHNHPSQVVPYEGAATGVGGNVRDVACMGAKVIGLLDPLRFGEPEKNECRVIANEVVRGVAGYGNPIGVPNLGGDINFGSSFNENCLVNVVTLGLVKESEIIHSFVPAEAAEVGYDIILVGKPTDSSGMGGAAFASLELDEEDKEANKGAVQEPNPFLKRHLLASTYDLFKRLKEMGKLDKISFKDMGAGGNVCSTVEQVAGLGFGATIDIEKIHTAMEGLDPSVIAASETQERFAWMCHPDLTPMILDHYNKKWELGTVAHNARASLVGKVTAGGQYVMTYKGEKVIDAKATDITEGLQYIRPTKEKIYILSEPEIDDASLDMNKIFVQILGSKNICSRRAVYNKYDKNVQGNSIIEAGEADAGLIAPLLDMDGVGESARKVGVAIKSDGISRYSKISPYWQAANATVESMRNVACLGATPAAITDCLNYNNPEDPERLWELEQGVKGISDACHGIPLKNYSGHHPTPVISGNVSLYNNVDATAVIACAGVIQDYDKAILPQLKKAGNHLFLLGDRRNELGAGEFYHLLGHLGKNVPTVDFEEAKKEIYALIDCIDSGAVVSAHDITEGGLVVCLGEMTMPHQRFGGGDLGVKIDLKEIGQGLKTHQKAFSESGGFVVEVAENQVDHFHQICKSHDLEPLFLGQVTGESTFVCSDDDREIIRQPLSILQDAWLNSLAKYLK